MTKVGAVNAGLVRETDRRVTVEEAIWQLTAADKDGYTPAISELRQIASKDLFEWARDYGSRSGTGPYGLPDYLEDAAEVVANQRGWTMSELIHEAVTEWLVAELSDAYQAWHDMLEQAGHSAPPTYRAWLEEQAEVRPRGAGDGGGDE